MNYTRDRKPSNGDISSVVDASFSRIIRGLGYDTSGSRGVYNEWQNYRERVGDTLPTSTFFLDRFCVDNRWYRSFFHELFQKFDPQGKKPSEELTQQQKQSPSVLASRLHQHGFNRYTLDEIASADRATLRSLIPFYLGLHKKYKPRASTSGHLRRRRGVFV